MQKRVLITKGTCTHETRRTRHKIFRQFSFGEKVNKAVWIPITVKLLSVKLLSVNLLSVNLLSLPSKGGYMRESDTSKKGPKFAERQKWYRSNACTLLVRPNSKSLV